MSWIRAPKPGHELPSAGKQTVVWDDATQAYKRIARSGAISDDFAWWHEQCHKMREDCVCEDKS